MRVPGKMMDWGTDDAEHEARLGDVCLGQIGRGRVGVLDMNFQRLARLDIDDCFLLDRPLPSVPSVSGDRVAIRTAYP